jgi:hypothetical protein
LGETFRRVNADFFAYIAGDKARFTEQGHIFRPGEWVRKQVVIINDRRVRCAGRFEWTALLGEKELGGAADEFEVEAGTVKKWTIVAKVPPATEESGTIKLVVRPNDGGVVQDVFSFSVVQKPVAVEGEVAIIDPVGKTLGDLKRLGIHARKVKTPPADCHSLVIGRQALTPAGEFPDIAPILTSGGTVLVMEQDEAVLSQRLGLRTNIPSLRRVFTRVPDHPVLAGLSAELLRDWRGEATLIPKQYDLPKWEESYPMVDWLGFKNTRAWKWRNQGQVASVVIEKLQYGDFLPILDGGFDEKYTALMEARVGAGRIIFCQMDVSGRTEPDPAADLLLSNLVRYTLSAPPPPPATRAWCGNAEATRKLLSNLRAVMSCANQPSASDVVVAGRDFKDTSLLRRHAESGGTVVMLDAGAEALKSVLPSSATTKEERLTHTPPPLLSSPVWRGVGPCDLHWRGRTVVNTVHLQAGASEAVSTGVLAVARVGKGKVITSAVTPDRFDYTAPNKIYLKLTCQHSAFLVSRLLANQGVSFEAPLLANWSKPVMPTMSLLAGWKGTTDPKETITPATVCLPEFDATAWKPIVVPGEWEKQSPDWANYDGIFWYRLSFEVPAALTAEDSELVLGAIDDEDWTYLNGKLLGHIGQDTNPKDYWSAPRVYPLPAGTLKAGQNILAIKVRDLRQAGGLMTGPVEIRIPARWLKSYYLDAPIALDDPYRYNRW